MPVLQSFFLALFGLIDTVLQLYIWILIIGAVLSWLIAFSVVNRGNRLIQVVQDICTRLTEPLLAPIRRRISPINGVDLSPVVLILGVWFVQSFLRHLVVAIL